MKQISLIISIIAIAVATVAGIIVWQSPRADTAVPLGANSSTPVGGGTYRLKAGISATASSMTLSSFYISPTGQEVQKLQMSDFGDKGYATLEPGSSNRQEFISFTGVTQNADGTATLTGLARGIEPISPYTASTTLRFAHAGGTTLILSNDPAFQAEVARRRNDESILGLWTFSSTTIPILDAAVTATTSEQFATKRYVDNVAVQGSATSSEAVGGIVELATALEQASTTDLGVNQPTVLQSKYATSSPDAACDSSGTAGALCNIIATNAGKLKQAWLDLTENFTWSGIHTFNATTTINDVGGDFDFRVEGDTDADLFSVDAGADRIGISTSSPAALFSVDGTALINTILFSDGTTQTTSATGGGNFIVASTTNTTIADTAVETSYGSGNLATLSGGTLGSDGAIQVRVVIENFSDAGANTGAAFGLELGNTDVCSTNTFTASAPSASTQGIVVFTLFADGANNAQRCIAEYDIENIGMFYNESTSSVDTSTNQVIEVTAQWNADDGASVETVDITSVRVTNLGR